MPSHSAIYKGTKIQATSQVIGCQLVHAIKVLSEHYDDIVQNISQAF